MTFTSSGQAGQRFPMLDPVVVSSCWLIFKIVRACFLVFGLERVSASEATLECCPAGNAKCQGCQARAVFRVWAGCGAKEHTP